MAAVILVVEDQPAMQRNMRIGLEMAGYEVVTVADGREALALLDEKPVSLILADVAMPRMNGLEALIAEASSIPAKTWTARIDKKQTTAKTSAKFFFILSPRKKTFVYIIIFCSACRGALCIV